MRTVTVVAAFAFALGLTAISGAADNAAPTTIEVWPGPAPGEKGKVGDEQAKKKAGTEIVTSLTNVTKPTLKVYRPAPEKNTGMAMLVFPGGGYNMLAWDHEGEQVAQWLNSIGITGVILKYRVPRREGTPRDEPPPQALMDAQRSLSLVRSKAADWGIDPKRIGVVGFSAGGHLGASLSTNYEHRAYEPIDAIDHVDCRPDFAVLIYPGGVIKRGSEQIVPSVRVTSQTPPMFLVHAEDDRGVENSVFLFLTLKRTGVPAELHIYSSGGHGFGLRPSNKPCSTWPQRCEEWLRAQGLLKAAAKS